MRQVSDGKDVLIRKRVGGVITVLLWLAVCTGLAVAVCTVIRDMCLATACSDAAIFTFFGVNMGVLGIIYFSFMLLLLWQRRRSRLVDLAFIAMVFSGSGAELRLLWIQKFIIGSWCPYCVTICCALFITAILLSVEIVQNAESVPDNGKRLLGWLIFVVALMATGLAMAFAGVHALT